MLLILLLLAAMIFAGCYSYKYYIKPKRLISWYKTTLQIMGYNVLVFPYEPYKIMLVENQKYNQKQYNDAFYDEKYNWKNYDVIISNTSYMITLIFINPKLLKHLFAPEKNYIIQKSHLNKYGFKIALGNTMILNEGQIWKRKRKILSEIFNFDFIKRSIPRMKQICNEMLNKMQQRGEVVKENSEQVHYKCELKNIFGDIISNIVIRCFFGGEGVDTKIDGISINKYLSSILKDARDQSTDTIVLLLGQAAYRWGVRKKYRSLIERLNKVKAQVKAIIGKRASQLSKDNLNIQKYTDILEAMWILRSNGQTQLSPLDQNQIIEEFCAFMTAGNDSTSYFVNMIIYYLCQNPEVSAKLREEIDQHIKTEQDVTFQNVKKVEYLEWVQLETTRMYGPATSIFLREATQDTTIDNIPIFKGIGLKMQLLPNHYNEKYFKNPLKFDPQRWNKNEQVEPYSFGGFSFGARTCLGKHLAYLSTKIITVMLLKRYKRIEIQKSSQIIFEFKGFYTPSPFQSILVKKK